MTQYYIGCKQVQAWPEVRDGKPGYAVKYPDGYLSWSPKDVFERAYLPMGEGNDGSRITQEMVTAFVRQARVETLPGAKTTIIQATLANGFEMVEASSCVDPANYDEEIGANCCRRRIEDRVWHLLGFLLQAARAGFTTPKG